MVNVQRIKQQICEIGDRLYKKGFAAANDGNISVRIGQNQVICTPTLIAKGFMTPEDLCLVDMEGKQIGGSRKQTSEVRLHLTIMKARPDIKAVVHCHPPHATAFGVAREPIPQCVLPEVEFFLGEVPTSRYALPGSQEFADTVLPFVHKAKVIVLANHGTVSYDKDLETAYWWTEILDAYCRVLMLAKGLGRIAYLTEPEVEAVLQLKGELGLPDPRTEMKDCDLCANDVFRESWRETGVRRGAFQPPSLRGGKPPDLGRAIGDPTPASAGPAPTSADQEALIQVITDRVMAAMNRS